MHLTQTRASLAMILVSVKTRAFNSESAFLKSAAACQIQNEPVNTAGEAGDIVVQREPLDLEAQEYKPLCTGSVHNAAALTS